MFEAEAIRLREILLAAGEISPLLNLGSSTRAFREQAKPHIERELFAPLRAAGVEVFHSDLKQAEGVDLAGDIMDPAVRADLKERGFRCVLCANMLEHVRDPLAVAAACEEIAGARGLVLVTVPSSHPFHADPIDNGLRPTPAALAEMFRNSECLLAGEVSGRSYREEMQEQGLSLWMEVAHTLRATLLLPIRPKSFRARAHRWFWYARPKRVAIVLVRVKDAIPRLP
jgi:hypothetical protein